MKIIVLGFLFLSSQIAAAELPSRQSLEGALSLPAGSLQERPAHPDRPNPPVQFVAFDDEGLGTNNILFQCAPSKRYHIRNDTEVEISIGLCGQDVFRSDRMSRSALMILDELKAHVPQPNRVQLPVPPQKVDLGGGSQGDIMTYPVIGHGIFFSPTVLIHSPDGTRHLVLQIIIDDGGTRYPVGYFDESLLKAAAKSLAKEMRW